MTQVQTSIRQRRYVDLTPSEREAVDAELSAQARVRTLERQYADVKRSLTKARLLLVECCEAVDRIEAGL